MIIDAFTTNASNIAAVMVYQSIPLISLIFVPKLARRLNKMTADFSFKWNPTKSLAPPVGYRYVSTVRLV